MLQDYDPDDIDVQVAELLVATSDGADGKLPPQVQEVLKLLRERLGMDVAFVSRIGEGRRTFEVVESRADFTRIKAGTSDPLEETWCQRVVDERLPEVMEDAAAFIEAGRAPAAPFPIGTHLSTPVRMEDGTVYGTLCCFSLERKASVGMTDVNRLRYTAQLLASKLQVGKSEPGLEPMERAGFKGRLR